MVKDLPDATRVVFADERAVANAGVLLPAILADRLGIEGLVDEAVDLGDRSGSANPGRRVMSLVSAMAWGADCIDDCDVLRSGQTCAVLGMGSRRRRRWGRFFVRSLSGTSASSTGYSLTASSGPGQQGRDRVRIDSLSMWIVSSARSMAMTSRARAMGTPTSVGITRSSRPAHRPGRCCISAPGRGRRTPPGARSGSSRN
jgi:hypothetical protein